jgi:hypothetical protein
MSNICPVCGFDPSKDVFQEFKAFLDGLTEKDIRKNKDFPLLFQGIKVPLKLTRLLLTKNSEIQQEIANFVQDGIKLKLYPDNEVKIIYVYHIGNIDIFHLKDDTEDYFSFKLKVQRLLNQLNILQIMPDEFITAIKRLVEESE